ncbi:alpha/beta fold hydrolase [Methylibium sp.]|uniref:alpha/beta fold hydrolase n=1 Tax=Methylibium sp. TaxID=2067992 RepID=UPI003D0D8D86
MSFSDDPGQTLVPALPQGDWLAPAEGHRVWWCEGGDPQGLPVLIVHGGPGGASRLEPTQWFDGLPVRWIAIDQRGCGRSLPLGETAHNDLGTLLDDMERLRAGLGLPCWALAGGSWGARVALTYALRQPQRVRGLLLRSPFLATAAETRRYVAAWPRWLGAAGRRWLGPAAADAFFALYQSEPALLHDGSVFTLDRLGADEHVARVWSAYDAAQSVPGGVLASQAGFDPAALPESTPRLLASWRIHAHYAAAGWGAVGGQAPAGMPALHAGSAVSVVWGAADATCDPAVARVIAASLPGARAQEVLGAGHRMSDPLLAPALRAAAREWVARLA